MIKLKSRDYGWAALAGFFTGLFAIPVLANSGLPNSFAYVAMPIVLAIGWAIGLWLGKVLSNFWPVIFQLAKFAEVGFLNTAIGFGILNIISILTGITAGAGAGWINAPGTVLAACNSYVWNKTWVFEKNDRRPFLSDAPKFIAVTLAAIIVNGIIIALFTDYVPPVLGLNHGAWLNVGKVVATAGSLLINFMGYKFFVFVKKSN